MLVEDEGLECLITKKIFDPFIELIGVKIMESSDKEFYVPNLGIFAV